MFYICEECVEEVSTEYDIGYNDSLMGDCDSCDCTCMESMYVIQEEND